MHLVNESHKLFKPVYCLKSLLFRVSILFSLLLQNCLLRFVRILQLISFDLVCHLISAHPLDHVLVLALQHEFKIVGLFNLIQIILSAIFA